MCEESLKEYRDLKNSIDTAFEEGENLKAVKITLKMIRRGDNNEDISELTELSHDEIEKLRKSEPGLSSEKV